MLITLSVAWLPVVPFLASDMWRLLRPLMAPRAARLRLPFAFASVVLALVASAGHNLSKVAPQQSAQLTLSYDAVCYRVCRDSDAKFAWAGPGGRQDVAGQVPKNSIAQRPGTGVK